MPEDVKSSNVRLLVADALGKDRNISLGVSPVMLVNEMATSICESHIPYLTESYRGHSPS